MKIVLILTIFAVSTQAGPAPQVGVPVGGEDYLDYRVSDDTHDHDKDHDHEDGHWHHGPGGPWFHHSDGADDDMSTGHWHQDPKKGPWFHHGGGHGDEDGHWHQGSGGPHWHQGAHQPPQYTPYGSYGYRR